MKLFLGILLGVVALFVAVALVEGYLEVRHHTYTDMEDLLRAGQRDASVVPKILPSDAKAIEVFVDIDAAITLGSYSSQSLNNIRESCSREKSQAVPEYAANWLAKHNETRIDTLEFYRCAQDDYSLAIDPARQETYWWNKAE